MPRIVQPQAAIRSSFAALDSRRRRRLGALTQALVALVLMLAIIAIVRVVTDVARASHHDVGSAGHAAIMADGGDQTPHSPR